MGYNYITHKHEAYRHQNVVNSWRNLKTQLTSLKRHVLTKKYDGVKNWYFQMKGDLKLMGQKSNSKAMIFLNDFYQRYKKNPDKGEQYFNNFSRRVTKKDAQLSK